MFIKHLIYFFCFWLDAG